MAWFEPEGIAATSGRLALRSEASARFERGVDPWVIDAAIGRFVELLRETSPGVTVAAGPVDARGVLPAPTAVRLRTNRANALLGTELTDGHIKELLDPIGFTVEASLAPGVQTVAVPSWRPDSAVEIDLIEEVARLYGYERIGRTVPVSSHPGALSPLQRDRRLLRQVMVGLGLAEAMPSPLLGSGDHERAGLAEDAIAISNPMVVEESLLRTSLRPGLLQALAYNESHRSLGVGLFELGHVVRGGAVTAPLPVELEHLCAVGAGRSALDAAAWWRELGVAFGVERVEVRAAERPGLHPSRTAVLVAPGESELGVVGEIDPGVLHAHGISERVAVLEVDVLAFLALPHDTRQYRRVSRYPSSDLDLAFVVADAVPAADVTEVLRRAVGEVLARIELFDIYRGAGIREGSRSLAYRLRLQADDRTLTDADVAEVRQRAIEAAGALGAVLRG